MRFLPFLTLLLACSTSTTAANSPAEAKTEAAPATVVASWKGGEISSTDLDESISTASCRAFTSAFHRFEPTSAIRAITTSPTSPW